GLTCAFCGVDLPSGSRFCNKCGTPVSMDGAAQSRYASPESYIPKHLAEKILTTKSSLEGERKIVTVLFVDVSGFTALAVSGERERLIKAFYVIYDQWRS